MVVGDFTHCAHDMMGVAADGGDVLRVNVVHEFRLESGLVMGRGSVIVWEKGNADGFRCRGRAQLVLGKVSKVDGGGVLDLLEGSRGVEVTCDRAGERQLPIPLRKKLKLLTVLDSRT